MYHWWCNCQLREACKEPLVVQVAVRDHQVLHVVVNVLRATGMLGWYMWQYCIRDRQDATCDS